MSDSALAIYTGKSTEVILNDGGTQAWVLNPIKARNCEFAVLCHNPFAEWSEKSNFDHKSAFLIGRISAVERAPKEQERWIVYFDEYAEVNMPDIWHGWRNPVKYTSLEELGIDIDELEFKAMPKRDADSQDTIPVATNSLTIEAAKIGLAATFGVKPEDIEITIRG